MGDLYWFDLNGEVEGHAQSKFLVSERPTAWLSPRDDSGPLFPDDCMSSSSMCVGVVDGGDCGKDIVPMYTKNEISYTPVYYYNKHVMLARAWKLLSTFSSAPLGLS